MSSNSLLNVPRTEADWNIWSFNHMQEHLAIIQAIKRRRNIDLVQYQLDPIDFSNAKDFLERHQQSHLDFDGILGLQSNDLQDVDIADQNNRESFVYLNWLEHYNANRVLSV